MLVEAAADGIEVECAVIGNDEPVASEPGQVIAHGDWYDYEAKYTEGGMELVVPAPITAAQRERVRRIAQEAFLRSSCSGLARVDFFVTSQGQVLLNELNTIPGFTPTSVFARLFEASGIAYEELLDRLLTLRGGALRRANARTRTDGAVCAAAPSAARELHSAARPRRSQRSSPPSLLRSIS